MLKASYLDITNMTGGQFENILQLLPPARQARAKRYALEKDKFLSASAAYLLALYCKEYHLENAEILYNEHQKPYFKGENYHFNLSHSGNMAFCAFSSSEVGADVQQILPVKEEFLAKILTHREQEVFSALSKEEKERFFTRLWAAKEAYIKYKGEALTPQKLLKIEVDFPARTVYEDGVLQPVFLFEQEGENHIFAVVSPLSERPALKQIELTFSA